MGGVSSIDCFVTSRDSDHEPNKDARAMGTKDKPGQFDCLAALGDDEPYFLLRSTDPNAPLLVKLWAAARDKNAPGIYDAASKLAQKAALDRREPNTAKTDEARSVAEAMEIYSVNAYSGE